MVLYTVFFITPPIFVFIGLSSVTLRVPRLTNLRKAIYTVVLFVIATSPHLVLQARQCPLPYLTETIIKSKSYMSLKPPSNRFRGILLQF